MKRIINVAIVFALLAAFVPFGVTNVSADGSTIEMGLSCSRNAEVGAVGINNPIRATSRMPWDPYDGSEPKIFPVNLGRSIANLGSKQLRAEVDYFQVYMMCNSGGVTYYMELVGDNLRLVRVVNSTGQPVYLRAGESDLGIVPPGPSEQSHAVSIYPHYALLQTYTFVNGERVYDNTVGLAR